ncbi:hypothetical protein GCM10011504_52130 [Siccirubricoccus deserti]|nr:hypothetical protein GCM10011504_52130 [Siccirubricoccus deserti]
MPIHTNVVKIFKIQFFVITEWVCADHYAVHDKANQCVEAGPDLEGGQGRGDLLMTPELAR